jgi:hypothetical protein
VAVLEEFSGEPLRHRLHDSVMADEQDLVLRVTREPLADAKQRARGNIGPRLGIRRQHIDQPLCAVLAMPHHQLADGLSFKAAKVELDQPMVERDRPGCDVGDDLRGLHRAQQGA